MTARHSSRANPGYSKPTAPIAAPRQRPAMGLNGWRSYISHRPGKRPLSEPVEGFSNYVAGVVFQPIEGSAVSASPRSIAVKASFHCVTGSGSSIGGSSWFVRSQ